ncbi:hypothetical protein BH10BAC2_BH10BAC2_34220 [soil metagenome]
MKKWFKWIIVLFVLILAVIYIFIPGEIELTESVLVDANPKGTNRCLAKEENWQKLLGSETIIQKNSFKYKGINFKIEKNLYEGIPVTITGNNLSTVSILDCLPAGFDSTAITWRATVETGMNPISKVQQYFKVRQLENSMSSLLLKMKLFTEKESNVYGIEIELKQVTDTFLVATKAYLNNYPSDTTIYDMIKALQKYIPAKNLKAVNPPMLNVRATENSPYETMVAIPIDRGIDDDGRILFKRMVPGKILITKVKGGKQTIKNTFDIVEQYVQDHGYLAPAISFESLITDRSKEADTAQWLTKVCYPIY